MRKAFTLIEVMIVVLLMTVMFAVMAGIFRVVLISWSSQETRTGVDVSVENAIKKLAVNDSDTSVSPAQRMGLREACAVSDHSGRDEIRFAVKERDTSGLPVLNAQGNSDYSYYIYYLYNANNSYPISSFDQSSYQLRRATLSGVTAATPAALDAGTFTYGAGSAIVDGVRPPSTSDLSVSGNVVTLDLSVKSSNETVRSRTLISPRNT